VIGEPGVSLPIPVALMTSDPGVSAASSRSFTRGSLFSTYRTGVEAPSLAWMARIASSRAAVLPTTVMPEAARRSISCTVIAVAEPPAPRHRTSDRPAAG